MNVFIETHGCELNKAESSSISALISKSGFDITDRAENADVIIINTCSVRESAETKVFGQLGVYKSQRDKKGTKLIVTGCMAAHDTDELLSKFPYIDFLVSNNDKKRILDIIKDINSSKIGNNKFIAKSNDKYEFFDLHYSADKIENYVPIQNGCNNFCSYCIVPFTRGREISRPFDEILREIEYLDDKGVRIVTLLGQNVNSYKYEKYNFEDMVESIEKKSFTNIKWFNFESPHPKDFSKRLIDLLANSRYFARHYHIPIQSANDRILSLMNRRYKKADIIALFDKIRTKIPDATFSSDIMMGFPTESDNEAKETIDFVKDMRFLDNFMYFYNPRPHTLAFDKYQDLPEKVKKARLDELIRVQCAISYEERCKRIGKEIDVIVKSKSKDGNMLAVTQSRESVIVSKNDCIGDVKRVVIKDVKGSTLIT